MALRRTRGLVRSAILAVLFLLPCLAFADAFPIAGTLTPADAIQVDGTLTAQVQSADGLAVAWTPATAPDKLSLGSGTFKASVLEARWTTAAGEPSRVVPQPSAGKADRSVGVFVSTRDYEVHAASLEINKLLATAKWVLMPRDFGTLHLDLGPASTCLLRPGTPAAIHLTDDRSVIYPSQVWAGNGVPSISAHCAAPEIRVAGARTFVLFGTDVLLSGIDPTTRQPRTVTAQTGAFTTRSATNPSTDEHAFRSLAITSTDDSGAWSLPGAPDVWIQTPETQVSGRLGIAESEGTIAWGNDTLVNPKASLTPQGDFVITGSSADQLAIHGETRNHYGEVAIGVGAAAVAVAALKRAAPFVQALFTRLVKDRALVHPRRRAIMDAVAANPGLHVQAVAQLLGLSRQTVEYHAGILCRQGLLLCRRFGRTKVLFPMGTPSEEQEPSKFRLRNASFEAVLQALGERPDGSQSDLARIAGLSVSRVSKILAELERLGIVAARREGRRLAYTVRDA